MDETQETIHNLIQAGFPANDITVVDGVVYVGGDAAVSLQASREMLEFDGNGQEQFRTTNLVDTSLIKTIVIRPASSLTYPLYTGLTDAAANYNDLGLGISFTVETNPCQETPGCPPHPPYANIDLIINPASGGTTATSEFPSGGKPGSSIRVPYNISQLSRNVIKHILTHELGHAIGLRHSDYYNRAISCGEGGYESSAPWGAIHIEGTPWTATANGSLMNTCTPWNTTGEFTTSDVTALHALY